MREILFRGKDIVGWHAGNLAVIKQDFHNGTWTVKAGSYISNSCGSPFAYQIRPETVGQFTGLTDKNGKKIFEGDIFVSDYFEDGKFVVVFEHGAFCGKSERTGIFPLGFANDSDETGCEDDDFYYPDDYSTHIKVVGNIHDNTELLS